VYDSHTTGAEADLHQATELARQMVTRWGMSARLGPVTLAPRDGSYAGASEPFGFGGSPPYSEATAEAVDAEVQRLLEEGADEALRLLRAHRRQLDALAAALLERETLDEAGIRQATGLAATPPGAKLPLPIAAFTGQP
jgi:cell division protease FtsH